MENILPTILFQPLPIPTQNWEDINLDFIKGLPPLGWRTVIMVVVDRLSKYVHFMSLSHLYTAITVAMVFLDNIFNLHGFPLTIVSDRDPMFTVNSGKIYFESMALNFC